MKYRIKEVLKEKGIKGVELAEMLGINKFTLYRNLSESNDLKVSTLEKIATALNVPLWSLLVSKEEITKDETGEQSSTFVCPRCGAPLHISVKEEKHESKE